MCFYSDMFYPHESDAVPDSGRRCSAAGADLIAVSPQG
uniref:Uncharacterized protein n=1 Tax=Leclercia adecarboxylata TaxID=83655 RepID=A0A7D5K3A1_9ENTR|nr:hypothetical protein [Leclercia adecarboxylata]